MWLNTKIQTTTDSSLRACKDILFLRFLTSQALSYISTFLLRSLHSAISSYTLTLKSIAPFLSHKQHPRCNHGINQGEGI